MLRHFQAGPGTVVNAAPLEAEPLVKLTEREADVLRLIAKGYRAPEVAPLLGLTPSTVTSYVRDIYRKLGISDKSSLVRIFADSGA